MGTKVVARKDQIMEEIGWPKLLFGLALNGPYDEHGN